MKTLGRLISRLDTFMASAAFAEEGEFDTAREILRDANSQNERTAKRVERDQAPRRVVQNARSK
ncbi:MAG: hypothetical protein EPN94_07960 [Nitrospirae bacterium]|nr:MAG: hypothetical protein EPN94_07960 [Nitrospirota bacterium]